MSDEEKNLSTQIKPGQNALMDPNATSHLWALAQRLAKSDIVPATYQNKPENCLIAADYANRIGQPVLAVMQNLSVIKGRPGLEAKMIASLINSSGLFVDTLQYEITGNNPNWDGNKKVPRDPLYQVRAFATWKSTGRTIYGPWITWDMVIGEGWVNKDGSKWKTMPELMFLYRAASFFQKTHCPELTMGMQTQDELIDAGEHREKRSVLERFTEDEEKSTVEVGKGTIVDAEETGEVELSPEEIETIRRRELEENGTEEERQQSGLFDKK